MGSMRRVRALFVLATLAAVGPAAAAPEGANSPETAPQAPPSTPLSPEQPGVAPAAAASVGIPADPARAPEKTPAANPPPQSPAEDPAAAAAYDAAFQLMSDSRWAEAEKAFREVAEKHPGSPQAPLALEMARLAGSKVPSQPQLTLEEPTLGASTVKPPVAPDRSGRASLAITSTVFGLWTGLTLGALGDARNGTLATMTLGAGVGLALSLGLTRTGRISTGDALLIRTGAVFGLLDGFLLSRVLDLDSAPSFALTYAGSAAGLLTTALIASKSALSAGDVSLITTFGGLGIFFSGMTLVALSDVDYSDRAGFGAVLLGNSVGLLAGTVAAKHLEMSRSRVFLCELGAVLGALTTGTLTSWGDGMSDRSMALLLSLGAVGGGLAAFAITKDMDAPEAQPEKVSLELPAPLLIPGDRRGAPPTLGVSFLRGSM